MRISHSTMAGLQQATAGRLTALIPPRDYRYLNLQTSQLRVWLPEPAKKALEELCEIAEMSMTAYLTELFACHLYGQHEVMRMRASRTGIYEPLPEVRYCAMSTSGPPPPAEPDLGKNIFALKIFLPEQIKDGLKHHADRLGVTLGEFTRGEILSHLFGREYWVVNFRRLQSSSEAPAGKWEADR